MKKQETFSDEISRMFTRFGVKFRIHDVLQVIEAWRSQQHNDRV